MIFQAGDSDEGREFAASDADAIFSRYATLEEGQAFYTDVKKRLAKYGQRHDQLKILPAASFVLGDTDEEAEEIAKEVRRQQVSGATAIKHLEFVWNRDLSSYDPDGPLPDIDPDLGEHHIARGRAQVRMYRDPLATAREWRNSRRPTTGPSATWSSRPATARTSWVPRPPLRRQYDYVQADAADGFILVPHITPTGLDTFADQVVPLLQEQGVFRTEYEGPTLRHQLGLAHPDHVRGERAAS
ncbi:LLM class flavin-dependent oxidoreductase OS=Streptomyces alboniger OX=132473 GN=CP975_07155 PE=3 SV=1 [Streptomyces alboniger]